MMIVNAIKRAYQIARERNWDKIYWAIDLHGVCFKSTYEQGNYKFINTSTIEALRMISNCKESVIILWSSAHKAEQENIMNYFRWNGIKVKYFNENPETENTATGCFDKKFYFSILLDDKAGFDPATDWDQIIQYFVFEGSEL